MVTFRILDPDPMSKNNATQVQNLDPEAKTLWIHMLNIVSGSETLSLYPEIYISKSNQFYWSEQNCTVCLYSDIAQDDLAKPVDCNSGLVRYNSIKIKGINQAV